MNTLPLESNGNISLKKLLTEEEFDTFRKVPIDLVEKFNDLRESTRLKLKTLGDKDPNLQFLTKTIYEQNGQTAEIQGMAHNGPQEMYEKINKKIIASDIGIHEGYKFEKPVIDKSQQKTKAGYKNQNEYIFVNQGDMVADTSEKEINIELEKRLTPTEVQIFRIQQNLTKNSDQKFPHTANQETYKFLKDYLTPENVNFKLFGKEDLESDSPFATQNIQETAQLEGAKLREATEEIVDHLNMIVVEINQEKKEDQKEQLLREFLATQSAFLAPLKYIWHTQGDTKKTDWINNQIQKFNDPQLNIENIHWEQIIVEKRNNIAVSTISRIDDKHKTIHANYGQKHLTGMHDRMLDEGWELKDIELTPVEYKKVPWWKRIGETIKKPFWKFKNRKERRKLKKLLKKAKKENIARYKNSDTQIEMIDEKGRSTLVPFYEAQDAPISEKPQPELKVEKTDKAEDIDNTKAA